MREDLKGFERLPVFPPTFTSERVWTAAATRFGADTFSAAEAGRIMEGSSAAAAEACARHVLKTSPDEPRALCLLAAVLRRSKRDDEALPVLKRLVHLQPQIEFGWRAMGLVLARSGERAAAVGALQRALDLEIRGKDAWFALGDLLEFPETKPIMRLKRSASADDLQSALRERRFDAAEYLLRRRLATEPRDPVALKNLADVYILRSRWPEARSLLESCLAFAPEFVAARFRYATMLVVHGEFSSVPPHLDLLVACDANNKSTYRRLIAEALAGAGRYAAAVAAFELFVADMPSWPGCWYQFGRMLRLLRKKDAASAFERSIQLLPSHFEAWFALATLKSFGWSEDLVTQIRGQLARPDLAVDDRAIMYFVLGRAIDAGGHREAAFESYRAGNEIRTRLSQWDAEPPTSAVIETKALFTAAFVRTRRNAGSQRQDPVFIVGMPRSGSTLVEQILSCHSAIEGLGESPALSAVTAQRLEQLGRQQESWPWALRNFGPTDLRATGEEYLARMRPLRKTSKPFFTDKQLSNFQLTGLIHLALPNARIIDVRRHPLDCGVSCFRHYFPAGQPYTSDLVEFGNRYAAYVELMAHFDELLPGKVHRVVYENLVGNFEGEVRRLLEHLDLPFEQSCLRFHENSRVVETLSFEQVFMPLYHHGVEQWHEYERWLGPLKDALGCILVTYPEAPAFYPRLRGRLRKPLSLGETGDRYLTMRGLRQAPFHNAAHSPEGGDVIISSARYQRSIQPDQPPAGGEECAERKTVGKS
ncbi:MAG TPA: sulfotransferase [Rhizomicrobium sp.]|nr:sulfotransferase [Rhizomicrobium sp.]